MIGNATEPAIELVSLTKRYGKTSVVDGLSLTIDRGATFGLLGPNGAGKSTTIKMMMGLTSIDAGQARLLGHDVAVERDAVRQHVGYVPELHHIYRWMQLRDVIAFARSFYPNWNDGLCDDLLTLFELPRTKRVRQLSKGMLAKLALLVAVSHEPPLLILDEPTSGLDPIVRQDFLDGVLRSICRGDQTVLFSSHVIDDVGRLADSIGIMHAGQLLVHEPVDHLLGSTKRIRAVLADGALPKHRPSNVICDHVDRREWLLTVNDFSPATVDVIRQHNPVTNVDVVDLNLEELFKDYIVGQRDSS